MPLEPKSFESHRAAFFQSWLEDPLKIASVTPSGRMLAKRMAAGIAPGATVLELGAGTGTLTEAIRGAGVRDSNLYLVEQNERLAEILRQRFPDAVVCGTDAESIAKELPELFGRVDYVVSGLPILLFDRGKKASILRAAFELLRPGGVFHQFTYLVRPPVRRRLLSELDLESKLLSIVPLNLPPAFVYCFRRSSE